MHAVRSSTSLFAGVVALLLCAAGGCDDDDDAPTKCSPCPMATLTGQLLGPTGPLRGQVTPWLVDWDPGQYTGYQHAFAGEDGRFSVCLPPGRYLLEATLEGASRTYYAAGGCVPSPTLADTMTITEQGLEVDFHWGALRLDMALPGHADGDSIRSTAMLVEGDLRARSDTVAEVRQERATLDFEGLPAGAYRVWFQFGDDEYPLCWYPFAHEDADAETLLVEIGRERQIEHDWPGLVRLSSAVHGCWSRVDPSGVPRVSAVSDSGLYLVSTYTDSDGDFTLDLILPEPFRIRVNCGEDGAWLGGADFEHAERFDLPAGTHTRDAYVAGGLVCKFEAPGPVAGEEIVLCLVHEGSGSRTEIRAVSAAGEAGIPLLPAGSYKLWLQSVDGCPGWVSQWFDRAPEQAGATAIPIQGPEDVVEIVVRTVRAGAIAGVISRRGGAFLGPAYLDAVDAADSTRYIASAAVDPVSGAFCLGGLEDGAYCLRLHWAAVEQSWYLGTANFADAEVLVIADGMGVTDLAWEVEP
jgi:hypothetical protein